MKLIRYHLPYSKTCFSTSEWFCQRSLGKFSNGDLGRPTPPFFFCWQNSHFFPRFYFESVPNLLLVMKQIKRYKFALFCLSDRGRQLWEPIIFGAKVSLYLSSVVQSSCVPSTLPILHKTYLTHNLFLFFPHCTPSLNLSLSFLSNGMNHWVT